MKQQVINYECDVLQRQSNNNQAMLRLNDSFHHRYGPWRLEETIQKYAGRMQHSVRWIGCDPFSHALSLFYCLLVGCLQNDQQAQDLFIKLKYSVYQQCKENLSISEQKILIQHLGLIQDSKNIGQFLKKSSHLQTIFIKIFTIKCSQMPSRNLANTGSQKHNKMEQLQWYTSVIPFSHFNELNQKCCSLTINNQIFLIIEEKQCFFVVQEFNKQASVRISQMENHKKYRDDHYIVQSLGTFKTIDMFETKHQNTEDFERYIIPPLLKIQDRVSVRPSRQKHPKKSQERIDVPSVKMTLSQQDKQHCFYSNNKFSFAKTSGSNKQKIPIVSQREHFHTEIKFNSPFINFGRFEGQKQRQNSQSQNKETKKTKNNNSKQQTNVQSHKQSIQLSNRTKFIHQSLSPNQIPFLKVQKVKNHTKDRIPKFLTKKNGDQATHGISSSPVKGNHSPTLNDLQIKKFENEARQIIGSSYKSTGNLIINQSYINFHKKKQT